VTHDLGEDDPVVAVGGAVHAVDRLGGDLHRGREAEARVGHRDVVVDGLREREDVEPRLLQAQGVLRRSTTAQQDQAGPEEETGEDPGPVDPRWDILKKLNNN
jgi:hypothetical protein